MRLRASLNKIENEPTNSRSIYYEIGHVTPAFHGIEPRFHGCFSLRLDALLARHPARFGLLFEARRQS
jgi:hypothetical protein